MKNILIQIKQMITILWKRHHFIIPPRYWGRYAKYLKKKIFGTEDIYYNPFIVKEYNEWFKKNTKIKNKK